VEDSNQITLDSYNSHIQEYVNRTKQQLDGDLKAWIDKALKLAYKDDPILELGSGFGRDADYIENQGYKIQRTDAAQAFVDLMQRQGHEAKLLNAITDDFGGPFGMVFANAVLLHFKPDETALVLKKAHATLISEGILAFSVQKGNGERWSNPKLNAPRYFYDWESDKLQKAVTEAGFVVTEVETSTNSKWLHVIAVRPRP
jgi:predicted TPR repeat methyltransferase